MIRRAGLDDCAAIGRLLFAFNREYDEPTPEPEVLAERFERLLIGDTIVLLSEAVMTTARGEGADFIDLNTSEDDTAARALYERLGFSNREGKPDGQRQLYYEREL